MSSSVKKIFGILIIAVMMVIIGGFILNILLPNVVTSIVNAVEGTVYQATGISFDWNGDGSNGSGNNTQQFNNAQQSGTGDASQTGAGVDGFQ